MQFKTDADQNSGILFGDVDDDVECAIEYEPANKALTFSTGNNTEALRIDTNQNVGIGDSSPLTPLHIAGNANNAFLIDPLYGALGNNIFYNGSAWDSFNHSSTGSVFQVSGDGSFSFRRATAATAVSAIIIATFFIAHSPLLVHKLAGATGAAPSLCWCGGFRSTCQSSSGISARAYRSQVSKARALGCLRK
jgi:hypothetical protein